MVTENNYVYRGITIGSDEFPVLSVEGLDEPSVREDSSAKHIEHGSWTYGEFLDERRVTIAGHITEEVAADFAARVRELRHAFAPQREDSSLVFRLPGETIDQRVYCKPTRKSWAYTVEAVKTGYMPWIVELLAGDPRIYSEIEESLIGSGVATNEGPIVTPWVWYVTGAASNPILTNETADLFVQVNVDTDPGDELVIDMANKTIKLNGVSIYAQMEPTSDWWSLKEGDNDITYAGGGNSELRWRSAW